MQTAVVAFLTLVEFVVEVVVADRSTALIIKDPDAGQVLNHNRERLEDNTL